MKTSRTFIEKSMRLMAVGLVLGFGATTAMAQNDITVTVRNIPSAEGKVLMTTDKGQCAECSAVKGEVKMVLPQVPEGSFVLYVFHDANGNFNMDYDENGLPVEYCAQVPLEVKADTREAQVTLVDIRKVVGCK